MSRTTVAPRRVAMLAVPWVAFCALACAATPSWLVSGGHTIGAHPGAAVVTALRVDPQGDSVVSGLIASYRFAGVDSTQLTNAGHGARFVARYDGTTGVQQFVAVVGSAAGGDGRITLAGLALDAGGNAYLPAYASSIDFPVTGGTYVGSGAPAIYRVSALGQVTRLSGALDPAIRSVSALALDAAGNLYLTGSAGAGLVTSAAAPYGTAAVASGCIAPFALKLNPSAQSVVYATYLGYAGTQGERCGGNVVGGPFDPGGYALAIDAAGNAYVTGQAEPGVRATAGAVDLAPTLPTVVSGGQAVASHAFVAKLNAAGTALAYVARLGGNSHDRGTSVLVDGAGNAYVAGKTTTHSFPTRGTAWPQVSVLFECLLDTPELGFLGKLSPDGTQLLWAGLLPAAGFELDDCYGSSGEAPLMLAADGNGNVLAAGSSLPSNRITQVSRNAIQGSDGTGFFAQVDGWGQLLYSTWLPVDATSLAVDTSQNVRVAGGARIFQISPGVMPVVSGARTDPACAGASTLLDVRVAGAGTRGAVDVQVDGTSIGFAPVTAGIATLGSSLAAGVRRVTATYHGPGPFDGHASEPAYLAVNQAGACS